MSRIAIPTRRGRKPSLQIYGNSYTLRNQLERCYGRLTNSPREAKCYDKTASSCLGFVHIAAVCLLIRHFVDRA